MNRTDDDRDDDWGFGDAWKAGSPEEGPSDMNVVYVEVMRCDTGGGFTDSQMLDLITYLGSQGIRATYDFFTLGLEPAAIKTYVLKVEQGREAEALHCIAERERSEDDAAS